jgi:hypothetical protein
VQGPNEEGGGRDRVHSAASETLILFNFRGDPSANTRSATRNRGL